jgi:hypothetical protein
MEGTELITSVSGPYISMFKPNMCVVALLINNTIQHTILQYNTVQYNAI